MVCAYKLNNQLTLTPNRLCLNTYAHQKDMSELHIRQCSFSQQIESYALYSTFEQQMWHYFRDQLIILRTKSLLFAQS